MESGMKFEKMKDLSIKKKILLGYLLIICITVIFMLLLLGTLWERLTKESISKSIYSSNYQIKKSIDNYFDSMVKLSEFPYLDSEIMDILRKDYEGVDVYKRQGDIQCEFIQSENGKGKGCPVFHAGCYLRCA